MNLSHDFLNNIINVSSKSDFACYSFIRKNDKILADKASTDVLMDELNKLDMLGKVVIGEGSLDKAPMLYTGEVLGNKKGPKFDIAVDPLEGTNFVANNLPGALTVIAVTNESNLFNAPETYMNKISAKLSEKGVVDLDFSIKKSSKFKKYGVLEWSIGVTNVYDRNNIFYYDRIDAVRVDQLPIIPSIGMSWIF